MDDGRLDEQENVEPWFVELMNAFREDNYRAAQNLKHGVQKIRRKQTQKCLTFLCVQDTKNFGVNS